MLVPSCDVQIRVRYAETDAMGYLHHAQYFVYFELGRTELLRQNGVSYREMEERGIFYVVARLECRFRAPARYDDLLTLTTTTERMTPVRVEHSYRLTRDGLLLTEARSTLVTVGRHGKPIALPDELYAQLAAATLEGGDVAGPAVGAQLEDRA
jgi:acyl-CoA thioester hydrolase